MAFRDGRCRAAFQHFAGIPGGRRRQLRADGSSGPRRGITRAAGQDHLRAIIQSLHEGFGAHHADHAAGTIQSLSRQRGLLAKRADSPCGQATLQFRARRFGFNQRQAETQTFFGSNFAYQPRSEFQMRRATCTTRGANHQWNARCNRRAQHQAQITPNGHDRAKRHAGAKVIGAGVNTAAINANHMRRARHAGLEARFRKAVAQNRTGGEKAYFLHAVSCPLSARLSLRSGPRLP